MDSVLEKFKNVSYFGLFVLGGWLFGYLFGYLNKQELLEIDSRSVIFFLVLLLPMVFLHVIVHEAGHALFGQLTGYQFISFRVGPFLVVKEANGLTFKRFSVSGTLGQCLMRPPEYHEHQAFPYKLYLLGGVLMNLILSLLVLWLFPLNFASLSLIFIGFLTALLNVIPMGFNDGVTLRLASKNVQQRYLLYLQLEAHALLTQGLTYTELPAKMTQTIHVSRVTYLSQFQDFLRLGCLLENRDFDSLGLMLNDFSSHLGDFIYPYQLELKKELVFYLAYCEETDERIVKIWHEKAFQKSLNQPQANNLRIKAMYAWKVSQEVDRALLYLNQAVPLLANAPTKGEAKVEHLLIDWLRASITAESKQEFL